MKAFPISIHSLKEVQDFVSLAMVQPFDVLVCNDHQQVNGKNYMGMFSLDYHYPVDVQVDCDDASFELFRRKAAALFAS